MSDKKDLVIKIINDHLDVDCSEKDNLLDDLGADSLDTVELVMALEEEFKTEIPDEEAENINTVNQAIEYINAHLK